MVRLIFARMKVLNATMDHIAASGDRSSPVTLNTEMSVIVNCKIGHVVSTAQPATRQGLYILMEI